MSANWMRRRRLPSTTYRLLFCEVAGGAKDDNDGVLLELHGAGGWYLLASILTFVQSRNRAQRCPEQLIAASRKACCGQQELWRIIDGGGFGGVLAGNSRHA